VALDLKRVEFADKLGKCDWAAVAHPRNPKPALLLTISMWQPSSISSNRTGLAPQCARHPMMWSTKMTGHRRLHRVPAGGAFCALRSGSPWSRGRRNNRKGVRSRPFRFGIRDSESAIPSRLPVRPPETPTPLHWDCQSGREKRDLSFISCDRLRQ